MPAADNTRHLAAAAARRHQATLAKANDAIAHLDRAGQSISFTAVAAAAEVSRSWLYRQPEIRDLITGLRTSPGPPTSTPASQRATTESLHALLDASGHEITRLRAENATLRNEPARRLGQDRADPPNNIHSLPPR